MPIKIALVDDHLMIRKGLRNMLDHFPHIHIIAEYEKGSHLIAGLREEVPDIVLLDLQLPDYGGEVLLPLIKDSYPALRVIIVTSNENAYNIKMLLKAGADGYVLKNSDADLLITAIDHVYHNDTPFVPPALESAIRQKEKQTGYSVSLTPRETDVLRLIAQELTSHEIGAALQINHRTVEIYRLGIMQKLGTKNMVGMVKKAILLGLIEH